MPYKDKTKAREYSRVYRQLKRVVQPDVQPDVQPTETLGPDEGGLYQVVWKCRICGKLTFHPSADRHMPIEVRAGTVCLKCFRERVD